MLSDLNIPILAYMDEDGAPDFSELDGESTIDNNGPSHDIESLEAEFLSQGPEIQASDSITSTESSLQSSHKKVTFDDAYNEPDTIPEETTVDGEVVEIHENNVPFVDANTIDPEDIRFVSVYDLPQPWKIRRMTEVSHCALILTCNQLFSDAVYAASLRGRETRHCHHPASANGNFHPAQRRYWLAYYFCG